jgi:hypothetical protein
MPGLSCQEKGKRAQKLARTLFPDEQWMQLLDRACIGDRIYVALSRLPRSKQQHEVLLKELRQAKMLTAIGSTVYLLPEPGAYKVKTPDAIVDGYPTELKWVTGNRNAVGDNFNKALKKFMIEGAQEVGGSVFLTTEEDLDPDAVQTILAAQCKAGIVYTGTVQCFILPRKILHRWDIAKLKGAKK